MSSGGTMLGAQADSNPQIESAVDKAGGVNQKLLAIAGRMGNALERLRGAVPETAKSEIDAPEPQGSMNKLHAYLDRQSYIAENILTLLGELEEHV